MKLDLDAKDFLETQPDQVRPSTCGACKFFDPPSGDLWRKITHPKPPFDARLEGWCKNGVACLGTVLRTTRDSTCKHFTEKPR